MLDATAIGATERLMSAARLELARGRFISDRDGLHTVVVVGGNLAAQLADGSTELALGDEIRMDNYRYTVVESCAVLHATRCCRSTSTTP